MTTKNFVVKNGLTTGNIILDASSSNITANVVVANLSVPASANLGSNANVTITGGTSGQYLQTDGSGALSWVTIAPSSSYGDSNVAAYLPTYTGNITGNIATLTGNVTASYFIGNGSQLTGLPATYANSNVASYLPTYTGNITGNIVTLTGNITAINANLGNLVVANYFSGSGNLLSNIVGGNVTGQVANALVATTAGTVTTNAQPNITSVGTLTDLTISGNLTVGGATEYTNVNNLYVKDPIIEQGGLANAGALTSNDGKDRGQLLHYYSGSAVDAFMGWDNSNAEFAFGSNVSVSSEVVTINTFGNVRANYFLGNASQLTGVIANANYALYSGTVTANAQPNITGVGVLTTLVVGNATSNVTITDGNGNGFMTATGNITAPYFIGNVIGNISGTLTVPGNNTAVLFNDAGSAGASDGFTFNKTSNALILNGNATATYFIGNGSQLTGLPATYANSNVASYLPTYTGNITGNIITLTGNVTAINANLGNLVTANYFTGSGNLLSNIVGGNVTGQVANALVATTAGTVTTNAQPNITSVGTLASLTSGLITATSEGIKVGNIQDPSGTNTISLASGNVTMLNSLNVGTGGTGNVTATYFIGNGSQLTGLPATYANSNVAAYLPTYTGNITGNIITLTGNVTAINANLGNLVTANYFSGAGNLLSNIQGGNVTGQVANALVATTAGTVTTAAQPNITSVGTLANVDVTANVTAGNILTDHLLYANGSAWTMSGTPGGSNTYIQFNDGSSFGGNASLVFNKTTTTLTANNLVTTSTANLGSIANVTITGGASGQVLTTNGAGGLSWQTVSSGGSATNAAFAFNSFSGNGVQDTFELSSTPDSINNVIINYNGAMQLQEAYTLSGANVTFDEPPADGSKVEVLVLNGGGGGSGGAVDASALLSPFLLMGA